MSVDQYVKLVKRIDELIRRKSTGTPTQIALKLGISRRAWYYLLETLTQEYSFPVAYCRRRQSYYYTDDGKHYDDFFKKLLERSPPSDNEES
ncbi:MAG: hypothetical protein MUE30_16845 [Spirosomaceae bacterium]|jgi:hypothetical protein|nr:hypothetical protein [Spirosomataceae bacterium]